jgi:CDP-diacylglycerol--glycerol-3-phosphate 3-phosphatidyltransferase
MAVVVVGREMLVTALRGYIEQQGGDFSASMAGKLKMVFQCAAAALSLYGLTYASVADEGAAPWSDFRFGWSLIDADRWHRPGWLAYSLLASVWLAVVTTVYSGVGYIVAAVRMLRSP